MCSSDLFGVDLRALPYELGLSGDDALKKGMAQKAVEFVKKGAEIYTKA